MDYGAGDDGNATDVTTGSVRRAKQSGGLGPQTATVRLRHWHELIVPIRGSAVDARRRRSDGRHLARSQPPAAAGEEVVRRREETIPMMVCANRGRTG
jgi:hypothetical protein